jgi:DNA-binding beta-propeller fold protein YncE
MSVAIPLPAGSPGIGFDDLRFSRALQKIVAPAGRSGRVDLIDPGSRAVSSIQGFREAASYEGGHDFGATSADERGGLLFVTDRSSQRLVVIDPESRSIRASFALASSPDYVRSAGANEVWVTQPDSEQIEVFESPAGETPALEHAAFIEVPGGPESLVIDPARSRAYTHLWNGKTVSIDLASRAIVETWSNGCKGSRGIALDEARGFLFVGCSEGVAVVLDVAHQGRELSRASQGDGVDVIDYSPKRSHLYVPGAKSATMAVFAVSNAGALTLLGSVQTAAGAHCVATDDDGRTFVCDPDHGQLIEIDDPFPAGG